MYSVCSCSPAALKNSLSFETTRSDGFCATVREQKVTEGVAEFWVSVIQPMEAKWAASKIASCCFLEMRSTCRSSSCCQGIIHDLLRPFAGLTQRAKCGYCQKHPTKPPKPNESCREGLSLPCCLCPCLLCPLTLPSLPLGEWAAVQQEGAFTLE